MNFPRPTNQRIIIYQNVYENTPTEVRHWTIAQEPERIIIQRGTKQYSLIFDEVVPGEYLPRLEVWDVVENEDELVKHEKTFDLGEPGNTVYGPEDSYDIDMDELKGLNDLLKANKPPENFSEPEDDPPDEDWGIKTEWTPENLD